MTTFMNNDANYYAKDEYWRLNKEYIMMTTMNIDEDDYVDNYNNEY